MMYAGYDSMGFDISLSKPHLRRELEADMKEFAVFRSFMLLFTSNNSLHPCSELWPVARPCKVSDAASISAN